MLTTVNRAGKALNPDGYVKHCHNCRRVFFSKRKDARFCGATCRQQAKRKRDRAARQKHAAIARRLGLTL